VLVDPRDPYRIKAGMLERCSAFDPELASLDICLKDHFEVDRASHSSYRPTTAPREANGIYLTKPTKRLQSDRGFGVSKDNDTTT